MRVSKGRSVPQEGRWGVPCGGFGFSRGKTASAESLPSEAGLAEGSRLCYERKLSEQIVSKRRQIGGASTHLEISLRDPGKASDEFGGQSGRPTTRLTAVPEGEKHGLK